MTRRTDRGPAAARKGAARARGRAGFTLIEVLMATALMGAILAALATVTAQWLPNWNRGFTRVQRSEQLALGLERATADIAAAEFVTVSRDTVVPMFEGAELSVTFVRSAIGPNARPGLEIVRLSETGTDRGPVLVRTKAPFIPVSAGVNDRMAPNFSDPVVLVRSPFRVLFSYAGPDRTWKNVWRDAVVLPHAVRITVRDVTTGQTLAASTATVVHAEIPVDCLSAELMSDCLAQRGNPSNAANPNNPNPSNQNQNLRRPDREL